MAFGDYPTDDEIKVEWTEIHAGILIFATVYVVGLLLGYHVSSQHLSADKVLTVTGAYINMWGAVVASLKTPFYGIFMDGGEVEVKRQKVERTYFTRGMLMVAIGFVLQAVGALV